jgi:hypothetical protein
MVIVSVYIGVSSLIRYSQINPNNPGRLMFNVPKQDKLRRTELVANLVNKHPTCIITCLILQYRYMINYF